MGLSQVFQRLRHWFPLFSSLRDYDRKTLQGDVGAGITTAVLLVPQGMAYALLAGLPPIIGLYASLVPPMAYALLGTSRQLSVGPVAMDSLLVAAGVSAVAESGSESYLSAAILLSFMVGSLQFAMGLLKMGFLVNFLSLPVVSGFTSAAALLIGLSQLDQVLGFRLAAGSTVWTTLPDLWVKLPQTRWEPLSIGLLATLAILVFKKRMPKLPAPLLVVGSATFAVTLLGWESRVAVVGAVPSGLPAFAFPRWDWTLVSGLLPSAISIALVAFMESAAVSKAYARLNKYPVSANRELLALGAANFLGSFFSGYPVTGGFSRTAVNAGAGARTQIATFVTVLSIVVTLLFLTPLFYHLPKAALAALILVSVVGLIDLSEIKRLHRVKRSDLVLLLVTFFSTLTFGGPWGLAIGVSASLAWLVLHTLRPHLVVLGRVPNTTQYRNLKRYSGLITYHNTLIVRMDAQFYFGNVAFLKESLLDLEAKMDEPLASVVLDASPINTIDSSGEAGLRELAQDYEARHIQLCLAGVKGPVRDVLRESGLEEQLGQFARFLSVHEAIVELDPTPKGRSTRPRTDDPTGRDVSEASAQL